MVGGVEEARMRDRVGVEQQGSKGGEEWGMAEDRVRGIEGQFEREKDRLVEAERVLAARVEAEHAEKEALLSQTVEQRTRIGELLTLLRQVCSVCSV